MFGKDKSNDDYAKVPIDGKPLVNQAGQKLLKNGLYDTGRKKTPINWQQAQALCSIQCTQEEIAAVLLISVDTLVTRCKEENEISFSEFFERHRKSGHASIRKAQFDCATKDKNVTMLKWLGMQHLNQKTVTSSELTGEGGGPIEFESSSPADRIRSKLQRFTTECPAEDTEE